MTISIESMDEDAKGLLVVDTGIYRPDNWYKPNKTAVTPGVIRKMILTAIEDGWDSCLSGTYTFKYQLTVDDVSE